MDLIEAARQGHLDDVQRLLEQGIDVNIRDQFGQTALIWASVWNHVDMVDLLLRYSPALDAVGKNGDTALIIASGKGFADVVRHLLAAGANPDQRGLYQNTPLLRAATGGHSECVEALVEGGADVNLADMNGYTALMWAARKGHVEVVATLLQGNARVNERNYDGRTALMIAACHRQCRIIELLIDEGALTHLVSKAGLTARIEAFGKGYDDAVATIDKKIQELAQGGSGAGPTTPGPVTTVATQGLHTSPATPADSAALLSSPEAQPQHIFISRLTCQRDSLEDDLFVLGLDQRTIEALEHKAKQLEMQDLLSSIIPELIGRLDPLCADALEKLTVSDAQYSVSIDEETEQMQHSDEFVFPGSQFFSMGPPPRITTFTGQITLDNAEITDGTFTLRTSKWYSKWTTVIDDASPYHLRQIDDAKGCIMAAHDLLHNLSVQSAQPLTSVADAEPVYSALEKIASQLRKARGCLLRPSKVSRPNEDDDDHVDSFRPPPPDDIILEFNVRQSKLLISCFALSRLRNSHNDSPKMKARRDSHTSQGSESDSIVINGKHYQVCDHQQIAVDVPDWGRALRRIHAAIELCLRVRDKVAAHFDYTT